MGNIHVLGFDVANLIAAGEVVDRPGSAVKELIENAIDAGASRITVEIQRGGVQFMRVTDNGRGMPPEDLPMAVRRHATSKIRDAKDLAAILTLGFRGEALAAIASVTDLRIISKTADSTMGACLEVHSGRVGEVTETGAANGTTVIAENLFANVPARLKFLKRDLTEAQYVSAVVEKVAMSHPEISFRLISDGNLKFSTAGDGSLQGVIRSVYGKDFAAKTLAVKSESGPVRASGFITAPDAPRSNRNFQNFFINGRYVKSKTAAAALEQAYSSYIPPEKFPGCVILLEIPPEVVDVNVHPSKLEVKFSDERPVFDAVYRAARDALLYNTVRPGEEKPAAAPEFRPAAGKPTVSGAFVPVRDRADRDGAPVQLGIADRDFAAAPVGKENREAFRSPVTGIGAYSHRPPALAGYTVPENRPAVPAGAAPSPGSPGETPRESDIGKFSAVPVRSAENAADVSGRNDADAFRSASANTPAAEAGAAEIGARPAPVPPVSAKAAEPVLAPFRIVGEIFHSYVIVEEGDRVTVFDKHAAHERLNFEKMKRSLRASAHAVSYLAVPVELTFTGEETAALDEHRAEIEKIGYEFSVREKNVRVTGIPMDFSPEEASDVFRNMAQALAEGTGNVELIGDTAFEKALYQASCKASIKAGRVYPAGYIEQLVKDLYENPEVTYCPHGRPVAFTLSKGEIDRKYKRS